MDTKQKKKTASSRPRSGTSGSGHAGKQTAPRRRPSQKENARRPNRSAAVSRRSGGQTRKPTPDVVYTPAKPFNRNRFLLRLLTVAAVVIAIVFGISIFFKVETVVVSGAGKYTAWQIKEASGIKDGDNLLTINTAQVSSKIRTALPYVDDTRIGIKLPDTVMIDIVELDVVYAVQAEDGTYWLMTSEGRIVEQTSASSASGYTNVLGIQLVSPKQGAQAQAAQKRADPAQDDTSQPEVSVTDSTQQLQTALTILQYLEANGIIGEAANVDVSSLGDLQLWYGQQYQVLLGDTSELSYKIECMKAAIDQMEDYQSGVLDVSFTIWPNQPSYTPF